ncbi:MAG: helix-hairpin-helix domain-containing protein [Kofleriaceae bacterium]|nr:helix-hairpin-helix domain-containing protein [Kofleriaceae bacterium]
MLKLSSFQKSVLIAVLCGGPAIGAFHGTADANQYEVFVDVDSEEDLYDLQVAQTIDAATFEVLVELMQRGVNLNTASRKTLYALPNLSYAEVDSILSYRDEVGQISDPALLVAQGILSDEKLSAIAAFLVLGSGNESDLPITGKVKLQTRYSTKDSGAPASALRLRAQGPNNLSMGLVAFNTRLQIGDVRYDPSRQALSADAPTDTLHVPKLFVKWETEKFSAIAGTYRIGFGQRLTFDNTNQTDPDGFYGDSEVFRGVDLTRDCKESTGELSTAPCPASEGYTYVTPDYKSRDGLLGVAASARDISIGKGKLEAHAFLSYQPRSIYQYELYNPSICDDPRSDDPSCSAPDIFRTLANPLEPTSEFSFQTLSNVYAEKIVGGNVNYAFDRRAHVGVTGYGSQVDWLVNGIDLDFQEWSSLPYNGSFGAVGVDVANGFGHTDVLAEFTRSFDGMPGGGGLGGIVRAVTGLANGELISSLRYYDKNFANPHARPIAASDEFEGLRARDELGGRIQYTGKFDKRFRVRTKFDFWYSPEEDVKKLLLFARGDMEVNDNIAVGFWSQYQDKDLSRSGRDQCYIGDDLDEIGPNGPLGCAGQKIQFTGKFRFTLNKKAWFDLQYQHEFQDDDNARFDEKYRQDFSLVAIATLKPAKRIRIRARTRYLFEDITDNTYLEQSSWSYVELTYRLRHKDQFRLRYDLVKHLDDRAATQTRRPNPENWLRVEYEAHF